MKLSTIKRRFNKEFKWVTYPNPLIKAAPRIWTFILEYFEPKSNQVEAQVKPANDVIKIIDEMIATSIQIEAAELDAGEDCDNEILIDHQGRIYALTQLKNRLLV